TSSHTLFELEYICIWPHISLLVAIPQLERDIISERTKDGLNAARARGRSGGRPKVDSKKVALAIKMYESKDYSLSQIKTATGIGATTLYRYLGKKA
ncbi:helix-turn-helix domain-containing protein, partial [Bacillus cereus]|uniref:helix-turn-helix domain-containing protein n=1 Tax=Bacillus cereus TaxID=1396 RepID=UPI002112E267|nr:helix-turn-helix domain-containing protein [Bacillus cereus]